MGKNIVCVSFRLSFEISFGIIYLYRRSAYNKKWKCQFLYFKIFSHVNVYNNVNNVLRTLSCSFKLSQHRHFHPKSRQMLSFEIVQERICRSKVYVRIYTGIRFIGRAIDILYFNLGEHFTLSHQALSSGFLTYYFGVSSRKYSKTRVQCLGDIPFITLSLSGGFWKLLEKLYYIIEDLFEMQCDYLFQQNLFVVYTYYVIHL